MAITCLEGIAQGLIADSLAASSQRAYASAQATFSRFCGTLGIPVCPASEQVLLLFVADMSQRVCHSTIRSYLSAVRHLHLASGFQDPLVGATRLELALKGLRKRKPRARDARLPITPLVLSIVGRTLAQNPDGYECLLLWAACCLGFFAFMRSGEITVPSGVSFDQSRHLTPRDISVDSMVSPSVLRVHLKSSKTDPTRRGVGLFIGRTFNSLCPVVAILRYLAIRGVDDGPLFQWQDGSPLTRQCLVDKLKVTLQKAGVDPTHYSGHSFRIGAATTAAAKGFSDATIQLLGRWASDSYTRYVRTPRQELSSLSRVLAD